MKNPKNQKTGEHQVNMIHGGKKETVPTISLRTINVRSEVREHMLKNIRKNSGKIHWAP